MSCMLIYPHVVAFLYARVMYARVLGQEVLGLVYARVLVYAREIVGLSTVRHRS